MKRATTIALTSVACLLCALFCLSDSKSLSYSSFANSLLSQREEQEYGDIWVLLVAGSSQYFNYRHQADICHAYQIVHAHGIPDERIVVMMYDDIAFNKMQSSMYALEFVRNPTPGILLNHPNGPNVYQGVPKDYTGEDVTPETFLNVLQGNSDAVEGKKVIRRSGLNHDDGGSNDHVFVYFSDHGAPGILGFPNEFLKARDLNNALKEMAEEGKFKKLVFYVEACESGSMFADLLPDNINVFATTASNTTTSSYACYYDTERQTYLGDVYSVKWMEDSDKQEALSRETLEKQYRLVRTETNTSRVQQYGNLKIAKLHHVSEFQGTKTHEPKTYPPVQFDAVPSMEVPVESLQRAFEDAETEEEASLILQRLKELLNARDFMEKVVASIVNDVLTSGNHFFEYEDIKWQQREITEWDCYEPLVDEFHNRCFQFGKNNYAMTHLQTFVNLCEIGIPSDAILKAMKQRCQFDRQVVGIH
ncbi:unnamed protein product [Cyprideis torosa]|uniref:legumain n=1 Tax=Cyprideis torosa TaxID=163714 RepID=A0A7R8W6D0_9CRUS|nr:unnamed protein product [Cyprideis torosa]CAG0883948.1 unnamed protein product [Cyprideis torosa]